MLVTAQIAVRASASSLSSISAPVRTEQSPADANRWSVLRPIEALRLLERRPTMDCRKPQLLAESSEQSAARCTSVSWFRTPERLRRRKQTQPKNADAAACVPPGTHRLIRKKSHMDQQSASVEDSEPRQIPYTIVIRHRTSATKQSDQENSLPSASDSSDYSLSCRTVSLSVFLDDSDRNDDGSCSTTSSLSLPSELEDSLWHPIGVVHYRPEKQASSRSPAKTVATRGSTRTEPTAVSALTTTTPVVRSTTSTAKPTHPRYYYHTDTDPESVMICSNMHLGNLVTLALPTFSRNKRSQSGSTRYLQGGNDKPVGRSPVMSHGPSQYPANCWNWTGT